MKRRFWFVLACVIPVIAAVGPASAKPAWVVDAHVSSGIDPDSTAIGRVHMGGMMLFEQARFGIDGQVEFTGFLRINDDKGIAGRSFSPINLGVRYGFKPRFEGPYVALGGGFGFLSGKPRERKIEDSDICMTAPGSDGERCSFDITQQINGRLGLGWGFLAGKSITVGVRLDLTYFMFNVADGEDQPGGAPRPISDVPRPQDTFAVLIGLEFLRWM